MTPPRRTYWGGNRQVVVDGELADDSSVALRGSSEQVVDVAGSNVVVRTKPTNPVSPYFAISLEQDGQLVAPVPGPKGKWER